MIVIYHLPNTKIRAWGNEGYENALLDRINENSHKRDTCYFNGEIQTGGEHQEIIDACQQELKNLAS